MTTNYTLTSPKLNGHIELQYDDGHLMIIKMVVKAPLNDAQFRALVSSLSLYESDLPALERLGLTATMQLPSNQKLALFCRLYEAYKKIKYRVSPADSGKIKLIGVDEDMLVFYFTSQNFLYRDKHSVSNLVRYYNELRAEIAAAARPRSRFPDHFDPVFQNKLSDKDCSLYWQHLRSVGWTAKTDRMGNVLDWVKDAKQV